MTNHAKETGGSRVWFTKDLVTGKPQRTVTMPRYTFLETENCPPFKDNLPFHGCILKVVLYFLRYTMNSYVMWVFPGTAYTEFMTTGTLHCLESYPESCPRIIPMVLKPRFEASGESYPESYFQNIPPTPHAFRHRYFKKQPRNWRTFNHLLASPEMVLNMFQSGLNLAGSNSGDTWMYRYQRTSMGNPHRSPT